jgi:hypothetical protein
MKGYYTVEEERSNLHTIQMTQPSWIGLMLCSNWRLKSVIKGEIEGRIEVTQIQESIRKLLLDNFKEAGRYCKLKEEHYVTCWCELALEEAIDLS